MYHQLCRCVCYCCCIALIIISHSLPAQPAATPAVAADNGATNKADLRILSWNIYMLEERLFMFTGQQQRAALIAAMLQQENYDLIVFQEAFSPKARSIIAEGLAQKYPYSVGPANNKMGCLKTNSGVWILSALPLKVLNEIEFDDCAGFDCYAHKGAIMVEGCKNGHAFQVIGTHLQAFDGNKRDHIRTLQYAQMRDQLLNPYLQADVPQFVCGDFNTAKKSKRYVPMLEILNANDGPLNSSLTFIQPTDTPPPTDETPTYATADYRLDSTATDYNTTLDYILCRQKNTNKRPAVVARQRKVFRTPWFFRGKHRKDLSDHYAIEAQIQW